MVAVTDGSGTAVHLEDAHVLYIDRIASLFVCECWSSSSLALTVRHKLGGGIHVLSLNRLQRHVIKTHAFAASTDKRLDYKDAAFITLNNSEHHTKKPKP